MLMHHTSVANWVLSPQESFYDTVSGLTIQRRINPYINNLIRLQDLIITVDNDRNLPVENKDNSTVISIEMRKKG